MKFTCLFCLLCATSTLLNAAPLRMTPATLPADTPAPIPVLDTAAGLDTIGNYRDSGQWQKLPASIDTRGLDSLRMHGSAEFTPVAFARWRQQINAPVTVFDLRQEAHGFINDRAITWYADRDWGQIALSHDAAMAHEAALLQALSQMSAVAMPQAKAVKNGPIQSSENLIPQAVLSEADLLAQHATGYVRLTVTDHLRPSDDEVERFISAVHALPSGAHVYFHCRAGQGRTTTFMAMYDMLRNASLVSQTAILARQAALGRDYDLNKLPAAQDWKYPYEQDRSQFIQAFYRYAQANPNGLPQTWKQWLSQQAEKTE